MILNTEQTDAWLTAARRAMQIESAAVAAAAERLDSGFCGAVEVILRHPGKLVFSGVGKSGHVARSLVSTFCSVGMPSVFLHAAEAGHGDFGIYSPGDPTILVSKSGATPELLGLIPVLRELGSPCIGILGARTSPLVREVDFVLDASVESEADPHGIVPTASAIVALALGHALAVALMQARDFKLDDFGRFHPAGHLGRRLNLRVRDVMAARDEVAWVGPEDSLKHVVIAMTVHPMGAACVVDANRKLLGLVTDGDVRRALQAHDDIRSLRAADIMTRSPVTVTPDASLNDAVRLMEDRPSQISLLPVIEPKERVCLGLVRLHDVYRGAAA